MIVVPLASHSSTPNPHIRSFAVHLERGASDTMRLRYSVEGDIERLQIPARKAPTFADGLWQHTCFECFIRPTGGATYLELNFSPSGEWAAYRFDNYRQGMTPLASSDVEPKIVCTRHVGRFDVSVETAAVGLMSAIDPAVQSFQIGVCAVVEDLDRGISYWAATHPPGRADFHHPQHCVVTWPPPGDIR